MPTWLIAAVLAAHPNSVSSSRVVVDGARVTLELRCQARTLREAVPELDRDDDGELEASELQGGGASIETYVREHLTVAVDVRETVQDGARLVPRLRGAGAASGGLAGTLPGEALVDLAFDFDCDRAPASLGLSTALFRESDPWHRDHAEIVWNGAAPVARVLWVEDPEWVFRPGAAPAGGVLGAYVRLGVEHILTGYDHVAFLIALIVASRRVRALLVVVTAFTLAHTVTLASAALGWFDLPGAVVEPAIALSIAWVGARSVLAAPPARLWPEALGFGLVHGLGFAGAVRGTLAAEPEKLRALFGFNLGVELGQLAIVATVALFLRVVAGRRAGPRHGETSRSEGAERAATLAPAALRRATGGVVAMLGLWWFVERAFGR